MTLPVCNHTTCLLSTLLVLSVTSRDIGRGASEQIHPSVFPRVLRQQLRCTLERPAVREDCSHNEGCDFNVSGTLAPQP